MFSKFSENIALYEIMWKTMVEEDRHALCMLDNEGYKHTVMICNTY